MIPMSIVFIDRKKELEHLNKLKSLSPSPFIAIVGRRRVGKTRLVQEFIKNIENSLYFFIEEKKTHVLLNDFSAKIGQEIIFQNWEGFIRFILNNYEIVIIDEFQNFKRIDQSFYSTLQKVLDEERSKSMLIAVGSYVSMMRELFEDKKSPLFGRTTEIWTLPPLPGNEVLNIIKGNMESKIGIYSMFGGFPKYYVIMHQYNIYTLEKIWSELIVRKYAPLNREPYNILLLEFGGEYRTYFSILEGIARGKASYVDIANYIAISTTTLARYLDDLLVYGVIEKIIPITEGPRSKKSRYIIRDQFIRFWFRYIFPNMDHIETENYNKLLEIIREDFPVFVSKEFEHIIRNILKSKYPKVGSWWNRRGEEIDVVALDNEQNKLLVCEIKWRKRLMDYDVVADLKRKSELIEGYQDYEKKYLVVSKSGFTRKALTLMDAERIEHWDLSDIERMIYNNKIQI